MTMTTERLASLDKANDEAQSKRLTRAEAISALWRLWAQTRSSAPSIVDTRFADALVRAATGRRLTARCDREFVSAQIADVEFECERLGATCAVRVFTHLDY